jgi:hypothetical protein
MREECAQTLAQREAILKTMQAWKKAIENAITEFHSRQAIVEKGAAREWCRKIPLEVEDIVAVKGMRKSAVR